MSWLQFLEKTCDRVMDMRSYAPPKERVAPPVIAHRGAWDLTAAPENSLAAFHRARSAGIAGVELDVHFTRDGEPVVNHDPDLRRLHRVRERIQDLEYKDLRAKAPMVCHLDEALAIRGLHFMIEIKTDLDPERAERLARALEGREPMRDYHLLALRSALVYEHKALPLAAWILVGQVNLEPLVSEAITLGLAGVAGHYLGLTERRLERLHAAGRKGGSGFVPTKNLYRREWARGVDWVFTNHAGNFI